MPLGAFVVALEMLGYSEEDFVQSMPVRTELDLLSMHRFAAEPENLLTPGEGSVEGG